MEILFFFESFFPPTLFLTNKQKIPKTSEFVHLLTKFKIFPSYTLIKGQLVSTFRSLFGGNRQPQKTISKLTDL